MIARAVAVAGALTVATGVAQAADIEFLTENEWVGSGAFCNVLGDAGDAKIDIQLVEAGSSPKLALSMEQDTGCTLSPTSTEGGSRMVGSFECGSGLPGRTADKLNAVSGSFSAGRIDLKPGHLAADIRLTAQGGSMATVFLTQCPRDVRRQAKLFDLPIYKRFDEVDNGVAGTWAMAGTACVDGSAAEGSVAEFSPTIFNGQAALKFDRTVVDAFAGEQGCHLIALKRNEAAGFAGNYVCQTPGAFQRSIEERGSVTLTPQSDIEKGIFALRMDIGDRTEFMTQCAAE